jgi:hypothetical protein
MTQRKLKSVVTFVSLVAFVLELCGASVTAQQGQSAMLVGVVRDSSGALLAGAAVSVSSPALIRGTQTVTTDRNGSYRLPALAPGEYLVTASANGFRAQQRAELSLLPGATVTAEFMLAPTEVEEIVQVTAPTTPLDVHTSASSTVISRMLLENLPLSRTVSDYVNLIPGVVGFVDIGVVAFGSSNGAHPMLLDGASGKETDYGTPGTAPSSSWIQEVQAVVLGADAQFTESTGVPFNLITRSGANTVSGSADVWTTRPGWVADNRASLSSSLNAAFRPLEILDRWSATAQLGGPIRTDRAWIFGGFDVYRNVNRPAGFASVANPENAVYSLNEPKWFTKLTVAPRQSLRVETYLGRDFSTSLGRNAGPLVKPEALSGDDRREWLWNARLTWVVNDRTLVEAQSGGHHTHNISGPADPGAVAGPPAHLDTLTGVSSGNYYNYDDLLTFPTTSSIALTRYATGARRSHQLKAGFEFEYGRLREFYGAPGGMVFYDVNGQPDTVAIQAPSTWRPDYRRESLYVQDGWTAGDSVTINAGVRIGFYQGAISGYPTQFSSSSFAPRVGVAWDPRADHTLAVRAHYGRYHEAMATSFFEFLDPLSQPDYVTAQVVGPNQFVEIARDVQAGAYSIDPHITYPYADEWLAGVDRSLPGDVSLTAQYVGRRYGSIAGFVGSMDNWTPVQRQDPGPDGQLGTADDGGFMTIYFNPGTVPAALTNPAGAYKHYNGVELIATRRAHNGWQAQASYTWSRTRASFDNAYSSNVANNDLSANGVYVNPNRAINSGGRTSYDFTHEFKVLATAEVPRPGGVRVSAVYRVQTGMGWGRTARFSGPTWFPQIYMQPRGSQEAPAPNVCDVRVEKTLTSGRWKTGAYADVFNVTNQGVASRVYNVSGPNFGTPNAWSNPRTVRAGVRVNF